MYIVKSDSIYFIRDVYDIYTLREKKREREGEGEMYKTLLLAGNGTSYFE